MNSIIMLNVMQENAREGGEGDRMSAKNGLKSCYFYREKSILHLIVSFDWKKVRKLCILSLSHHTFSSRWICSWCSSFETSSASANIEKHFGVYCVLFPPLIWIFILFQPDILTYTCTVNSFMSEINRQNIYTSYTTSSEVISAAQ